ncbi:MAG: hypothetical protein J0I32_19990 [Sphingobacteriales bacterium]|nr:hypothetical protein [Sphingobacteriales bacterium]OJV98792.1 MAG: hypothetical protein BGO52_08450 [Sphingobacteriales bacterium 44-61]
MTITQAEEKLFALRQKRKALDQEINDLRYLIADLSGAPLRKDHRARNRKIYVDWNRNKRNGKKQWQLRLSQKYDLGSDRLRAIYNLQKELREKKKS